MRILLVEDNADHRELMSLALTGHDPAWQVEEAATGAEALRLLAEEAYDLVFLDYSLPGRSGLGVLEKIQGGVLRSPRLQSKGGETPPPVVMVTARGDEQVAVEAMKAGASDYMVKSQGYLQQLPVIAQRAVEAHQLAVERNQAEEEIRQRNRELAALHAISTTMMESALDLDEVLQRVADSVVEGLGCNTAVILLLDEKEGVFKGTAVSTRGRIIEKIDSLIGSPLVQIKFPARSDFNEAVSSALEGRMTIKHDLYELVSPVLSKRVCSALQRLLGSKTFFSLPLLARGKVVGGVFASTREEEISEGYKETMMTFANQAAIAIKNARLFEEIEQRQMYLEGVLGAAPDAIVTLDAHHRIVEWNPGAEKLFGYSREEAIGQNLDDLVTSPDVLEEAVGFTQMAMSGKEVPPTEAVRYRKDGSPVDVIVAGSPIVMGDELIGIVAVYTDITERVRMEETLRALALLDELTGLYNRRGFVTLAEQQLKTAKRARRRMALLFADLDNLKRINDTFGHPEGDRALIEVANIFTETFRESDIVARIGGDEFVVLAIETDSASADILTARLQENLEARNAEADRRYELSLSVGLARYDPESPCSIDELLARADRAMYERKRG